MPTISPAPTVTIHQLRQLPHLRFCDNTRATRRMYTRQNWVYRKMILSIGLLLKTFISAGQFSRRCYCSVQLGCFQCGEVTMFDLCLRSYCWGDVEYRFKFDSEGGPHYRDYFAVYVLGARAMGRCNFSISCYSDQIIFPTCLANLFGRFHFYSFDSP